MNEQQVDLIMIIVREQLGDYLAEELADDIARGIREGINDNKALLEKLNEAEPEIEGDRHTWFYVCGECHAAINWKDRFCKWCGRRQRWDGDPEGNQADRPAGD